MAADAEEEEDGGGGGVAVVVVLPDAVTAGVSLATSVMGLVVDAVIVLVVALLLILELLLLLVLDEGEEEVVTVAVAEGGGEEEEEEVTGVVVEALLFIILLLLEVMVVVVVVALLAASSPSWRALTRTMLSLVFLRDTGRDTQDTGYKVEHTTVRQHWNTFRRYTPTRLMYFIKLVFHTENAQSSDEIADNFNKFVDRTKRITDVDRRTLSYLRTEGSKPMGPKQYELVTACPTHAPASLQTWVTFTALTESL